jgi:hypothetical protein
VEKMSEKENVSCECSMRSVCRLEKNNLNLFYLGKSETKQVVYKEKPLWIP